MGSVYVPVTIRAVGAGEGEYRSVFLVDTGAMDSMAPASELRKIGVRPVGSKTYELADGTRHEFQFGLVQLEFTEEVTATRMIFGPDGVEPLLGVIALESAGVVVDPVSQTLKRLPVIGLKRLAA
jgi:clan AA aspartic protease